MATNLKNIWVLDDDQSIRWVIEKALNRNGYIVKTFDSVEDAMSLIGTSNPDLILSDVRMPGKSGLDFLEIVKRDNPQIPVIIMTAYSDVETTVDSYKAGAYEYISKPFDINDLLKIVNKASSSTKVLKTDEEKNNNDIDEIIGKSNKMQKVYNSIGKLSSANVNVLLSGETGTGKELIAKALHNHGPHKNGPFIPINTGSIPTELLESELFGHEKGSFTGAFSQRIGRFEQAENGSLFLDEIGDMPLDVQARLLRVLQEGEFYRVGGTKLIKTNVRIISATNKNLAQMVKGKLFREDLLHRINVIKIDLPPLRERSEDIETLIKYFLNQFSKEYKISLKNLDSNVLNILKDYSWPGNVRQLQNICKYLTIMSSGNNILVDDLPKEIFEASEKLTINSSWQETFKSYLRSEYKKGSVDITKITDADYEECLIKFAMEICNGKKIEAAKLLGWGRNTIANKIKNIT